MVELKVSKSSSILAVEMCTVFAKFLKFIKDASRECEVSDHVFSTFSSLKGLAWFGHRNTNNHLLLQQLRKVMLRLIGTNMESAL